MNTMDLHREGGMAGTSREQIVDEISWLMKRLGSMGFEGDCGYERGLANVYQDRLDRLLESIESA